MAKYCGSYREKDPCVARCNMLATAALFIGAIATDLILLKAQYDQESISIKGIVLYQSPPITERIVYT